MSLRPSTSAPPRVAKRNASRAVISMGAVSQPKTVRPSAVTCGVSSDLRRRASNLAWRASFNMWAASLLALPSTPKPTGTPASIIFRMGAMPLAKRILLQGQCAIPVRVAANSEMPSSSNLTQCACHTSSPNQPKSSAYWVGVLLNFSKL